VRGANTFFKRKYNSRIWNILYNRFPSFFPTFSTNKRWWRLRAFSSFGKCTREPRLAHPQKGRLRQRVTMRIWKQRAKLVMATARWVLKHPVYGIVILRLGIYTSRPNISKLCSFIGSTNPSILILIILENKHLASLLCFQKICLLSKNDLCFL